MLSSSLIPSPFHKNKTTTICLSSTKSAPETFLSTANGKRNAFSPFCRASSRTLTLYDPSQGEGRHHGLTFLFLPFHCSTRCGLLSIVGMCNPTRRKRHATMKSRKDRMLQRYSPRSLFSTHCLVFFVHPRETNASIPCLLTNVSCCIFSFDISPHLVWYHQLQHRMVSYWMVNRATILFPMTALIVDVTLHMLQNVPSVCMLLFLRD